MFLALLEAMIQKRLQKQTSNKNPIKQTKNPLILNMRLLWDRDIMYLGDLPVSQAVSPSTALLPACTLALCTSRVTSVYPECRGFSSRYFWVTEPLACTFSANHPRLLWDVCKHPPPPQAQTFLLLLWPLHKLIPTECTSVYMCMAIPAVVLGPH